eukprot:CAMPEP_0185734438 /NCGR_PEP_ID=MMETSP1171-20130828/22477_1 /TAXON_ID=374046 /ORGANISM="Helicotheca tamensis, Strain CCMP826" /LENGTH=165 /DNA_ID=CAMNT_0028404429 /DNA_START=125 /DNA_END=619 /DNA_ORIENTATION=+
MKTFVASSTILLFLTSKVNAKETNTPLAFVPHGELGSRKFKVFSPLYYQSAPANDVPLPTPRKATIVEAYDIDNMIECAESYGECSIEDLESMAKELEFINEECFFELDELEEEHCDKDAQEGREILKRTLDLQHELSLLSKKLKESRHVNEMRKKDWPDEEDHW